MTKISVFTPFKQALPRQALFKQRLLKLLCVLTLCLNLTACVGVIVGAVVDTTIEVAKIPFKVVGAVVDVATGDDEPKRKENRKEKHDEDEE